MANNEEKVDVTETEEVESKQHKILKYVYPSTDFGGGAWKAFHSTYLSMLYTDIYLIPVMLAGALEMVSAFTGWFAGPMWGTFLDKVTLKVGKYWQWVLIGSVGTAIIYMTIFALPSLSSDPSTLAVFVFALAVALAFTQSICNTTLVALYPRLGDSSKDRSFLAIGRSIGRTGGKTVFGWLSPLLLLYFTASAGSETGGWAITGIVLGLIGLVFYVVFALYLKKSYIEDAARADLLVPKAKRPKVPLKTVIMGVLTNGPLLVMFLFFFLHKVYDLSFQTMSASYFFKYYVGDMSYMGTFMTFRTLSQAGGVALGLVWLKFLKDSKRAFVVAGILHIAALLVGTLIVDTASTNTFMFVMFASQVFVGLMEAYTLPFFAAAADYARLKTGVRADGLNMSVYGLALRVAITVGTLARVSALSGAGYDPAKYVDGVGPSAAVLTQFANLQTLYPLIIAVVAVGLVAFFYPITDNKLIEIKRELKKRDAAQVSG